MTEKEISETMQKIRVTTFASVTENGHIGCVESSDGTWRIYIGVDGMPKDLHVPKDQIREPLTGLGQKVNR